MSFQNPLKASSFAFPILFVEMARLCFQLFLCFWKKAMNKPKSYRKSMRWNLCLHVVLMFLNSYNLTLLRYYICLLFIFFLTLLKSLASVNIFHIQISIVFLVCFVFIGPCRGVKYSAGWNVKSGTQSLAIHQSVHQILQTENWKGRIYHLRSLAKQQEDKE